MLEHALQKQVADHLASVLRPPVWWSAIDHAAKLNPRQGAERKRRGVKRGIADFLIMWPGAEFHTNVLWIELKRAKGGSLTPEQRAFADDMLPCNTLVSVCRSIESVDKALEAIGVPHLKLVKAAS